ncbi:hypothetical protein ACTFIZ_009775 [Dictyostelium cf. discoideum]
MSLVFSSTYELYMFYPQVVCQSIPTSNECIKKGPIYQFVIDFSTQHFTITCQPCHSNKKPTLFVETVSTADYQVNFLYTPIIKEEILQKLSNGCFYTNLKLSTNILYSYYHTVERKKAIGGTYSI